MTRNPFGVPDVPDPDGRDVAEFADGIRMFDWDEGAKQGLIEARHDGRDRLIGRYLNLSAPEITRPWVGLIVDTARIDGRHSGGRIDFRR